MESMRVNKAGMWIDKETGRYFRVGLHSELVQAVHKAKSWKFASLEVSKYLSVGSFTATLSDQGR